MPLGFSGGSNLIAMGERYGDKLARGIEQGGAIIEQALQRVTTQRQLEGLGQTMSQLDPNTPDYTQKLMEIAPQFPFAMQDPRGQAIFSMGVQAHKQWAQGEQAKTQFANQQTMQGIRQRDTLANQQTMQGLRHRDTMTQIEARNQGRGNDMVDLTVPDRLAPQNPAAGIMTGGMSAPMEAAQDLNAPDETATLMGMSGGLDEIKAQYRGMGINELPKKEIVRDAREQRRYEESRKMQEDRQAEAKTEAQKKAADSAKDKAFANRKSVLDNKLRRLATAAGKERDALAKIERDPSKKGPNDRDLDKDKQHMEQTARLQKADADLASAEAEMDALLKEIQGDGEGATPRFRYESGKFVPK